MIEGVSNFFVKADNACDYVPIVSTFSNLTDLFQKCVVLPCMSNQSIVNSHYYTHLKSKSILRCIFLLIPVIGNIIVGIYDFANRKYSDRNLELPAVHQDGRAVEDASEWLKDDKDVVLAGVEENGLALEDVSEQLKGDKDVVLAAVKKSGLALKYASEQLKGDRGVVLAAIHQNPLALKYASEQLKGDKDVVLAAVQQNGLALHYANEQLKGDRDVVRAAIRQNPLTHLWHLSMLVNSSKVTGV